jgi:hypothetical protein
MRRSNRWIGIMCAAALMLGTCSGPIGRWFGAPPAGLFRSIPPAEQARIGALFQQAWRGRAEAVEPARWSPVGFLAETAAAAGGHLRLREPENRIEGRGRYAVRAGARYGVLLQAPHDGDDLLTGEIVRGWFDSHGFAGAAFNSLSRWSVDNLGQPGDLARRGDTVFAAFAAAFLAEHRNGVVAEIHGFDSDKRTEQAFAAADLVISEGTTNPTEHIYAFRGCLDGLLPGRVLVFPDETLELGGTGNTTAQLVRDSGHGYFLHLELSLPLRQRLVEDTVLARGFAQCLLAGGPR